MITTKEFLEKELEWGISFANPTFKNLAKVTAEQFKDFPIKTVMDFGAGTGVYSDAFHNEGYETFVYEIWDEHKVYIKENAPHLNIIDKPITTDLMAFIEVAEHMTDKEILSLFKSVKPTYVLFSSTSEKTDYDEQWGHINVKPQAEWVAMFKKLGYELDRHLFAPTSWSKLFKICL
jgi:2-polyprenyl-3-methyl-5-hydroxy-6-metoxy-1,4-benzoquinol methylase